MSTEEKVRNMINAFRPKQCSAENGDCSRCPAMVGFTLCPSTHQGPLQHDIVKALKEVLKETPDARVVTFSRSNLFRTGIASHGLHRRFLTCGASEQLVTYFPFPYFQCELPHVVQSERISTIAARPLRRGPSMGHITYCLST